MDCVEREIKQCKDEPWAKAMMGCPQDPEWHGEGDVWEHAKMVARQLPYTPCWDELKPLDREILLKAALYHDSGKPMVTREEKGRLRSPNHSKKGEALARWDLYQKGYPVPGREAICALIRYHHRPVQICEREIPEREVAAMSWKCDNRLLYSLSLADCRGRCCSDRDENEQWVELFRETAEKNYCFGVRYPFLNDETRLAFFRSPDASIHQQLYDFREFTATMMCGLPGSGKSTWIGKEVGNGWVPVVELDAIRHEMGFVKGTKEQEGQVQQEAKEQMRQLLAAKKNFYYDATNLSKAVRQRITRLFLRYGAKVRMVHLDLELETILKQNAGRERPVPPGIIVNMAKQMEPPGFDECHELSTIYASTDD